MLIDVKVTAAYEEGTLQNLKAELDKLQTVGMWLSDDLYNKIINTK